MPTDYSTVADLNSLFNKIYQGAFFVQRQTELLPRLAANASARTMAPRQFSTYTKQTAATVAEGEAPAKTKLVLTAGTTITPVIYHHIVPLTDERIMTDEQDARRDAAKEGGEAVRDKIEKDGIAKFASFTHSTGATNAALTLEKAAIGMTKLMAAGATGQVNVVIHPYEWHNIMKNVTNIQASPTPSLSGADIVNEAMRSYFVSNVIGARWWLHNSIDPADVAKVQGGMFTADALLWDERTPLTLEASRAAAVRGWDMNFVARGGWGVPKPDFGVKLLGSGVAPS